jgi:hypothetical protein
LGKLPSFLNYRFFRPFQFFDHTARKIRVSGSHVLDVLGRLDEVELRLSYIAERLFLNGAPKLPAFPKRRLPVPPAGAVPPYALTR